MNLSKQNLISLKDLLVATLKSYKLVSNDIEVNGDEIIFHLYDPDAPDLHSQDRVRIRLELLPSLKRLKEDYPEVFI